MYWHDGIILHGSNRTNIEIVLIIEKEIMESILFIFVLIFLFNNSSNLYYIKQSAYLKLTVKKSIDY